MNHNKLYIALAFLTLAFTSCQEDLYTGPCNVRFKAYVQDEVSVTRNASTYTTITNNTPAFDAALYVSFDNLSGVSNSEDAYKEYTLSWNGSNLSSTAKLETGHYTFYGYAPKVAGSSFDNENKKITIPSILALTTTDLMVIKQQSTEIKTADKTVALQMDHLLAKITPCFFLNSTYAELRDIRIKKVVFSFDSAPTYTATVNYTTSPHTFGYEPIQNSQAYNVIAYKEDNPKENHNLPPTKDNDADTQVYQECGHCYIVPTQSTSTLKMKVTYDVYDKSGTLTRKDATATNQIKKLPTTLEASTNYKLKIQIIPTYLYVLSDNDESSVLVISNN